MSKLSKLNKLNVWLIIDCINQAKSFMIVVCEFLIVHQIAKPAVLSCYFDLSIQFLKQGVCYHIIIGAVAKVHSLLMFAFTSWGVCLGVDYITDDSGKAIIL